MAEEHSRPPSPPTAHFLDTPAPSRPHTAIGTEGGTGANTPRRDPGGVEGIDDVIPQTPQVSITFLLVSGRRRTMAFEPETTVGRVKELVWNAWPNDWQDERPPAPSYLRVLYLGKILQDDDTLDKLSFPTQVPSSSNAPTIVHLSIRAFAPPSEEVPKKKRRNTNQSGTAPAEESEETASGCCASCIIC